MRKVGAPENEVSRPNPQFAMPEGAPPRPFGNLGAVFMMAALLAVLAIVQKPESDMIFWALMAAAAALAAFGGWRARQFEREGWYEKRETPAPEVPITLSCASGKVSFGVEAIEFSSLLQPKRAVPYTRIKRVEIACRGVELLGVKLHWSQNNFYPVGQEPEIIVESDAKGEITRQTLTILRRMAPDATFEGPEWVEQGWVPRTGFELASQKGGGGDV